MTWSVYGVELHMFTQLIRYVSGDLRAGRDRRGRRTSLAHTLVAVNLYAAVARGDADAVERGHALEPSWSRDGLIALVAGGCTDRRAHLARGARRGDRAGPAAARAPVARVVRLLPGRHLAGRAGHERPGRRRRAGAAAGQGRLRAARPGRPAAGARDDDRGTRPAARRAARARGPGVAGAGARRALAARRGPTTSSCGARRSRSSPTGTATRWPAAGSGWRRRCSRPATGTPRATRPGSR